MMMMMEYQVTVLAVLLVAVHSQHLVDVLVKVSRAQRLAVMAFSNVLFFYVSPCLKQEERDKVNRNEKIDRQCSVTCLRSMLSC